MKTEEHETQPKPPEQSAPEPQPDTVANSEQHPEITADLLRKLADVELMKLAERAGQAQNYLDLARRTQADFENFQKRAEARRQDEARYAISPLVRELVAGVDNLERALVASEKSRDFDALYKGLGMTHQQMVQVLQKFGVQLIEPTGQSFDPEWHEAVMMATDEGKDDNVVLEVFEKGWRLHDRLLRAAKVKVNKRT